MPVVVRLEVDVMERVVEMRLTAERQFEDSSHADGMFSVTEVAFACERTVCIDGAYESKVMTDALSEVGVLMVTCIVVRGNDHKCAAQDD